MFTPKALEQPKIADISTHSWKSGFTSYTDQTRTNSNSLVIADNVLLEQDNMVRPWPSTVLWGTQPLGEVLGWDEIVRIINGKPETWVITMQVVGGVANVYVQKDGGVWTKCTGKDYSITAKAEFVQGGMNSVLVMNGQDNLTILNASTLVISVFASLATPSAPSLTPTGLSGSAITYRYRVSALNDVGETAASVASTVAVGTDRDAWDPATQFVTLTWGAISGAKGYAIYLGLSAGKEVLITTLSDSSTSYKDTGTAPMVTTRLAPAGNSTTGPIVGSGANVAGQLILIRDKDYPYRAWFGGSGESATSFNPFDGGGWIDINLGTKDLPARAVSFRDGKGTPMATILLKGTNGTGKLVHMTLETQSLADVIISYMAVIEANGQDGTDSPKGVILYKDAIWYPSRDGFKTTGTKPSVQNILSTSNISDSISQNVERLNQTSMSSASGIAYQGRLYWALPVGSTRNNQIWTLDLTRGGQWMLPRRINADQLLLYTSSDGITHFLALVDNQIVEFTRSRASEDQGVGFPTRVGSGHIKASENGMEWMYVIDVTFTLINPQGNIRLNVKAKTEDEPIASVGAKTFKRSTQYAGWGEINRGRHTAWGKPRNHKSYWGEIVTVPTTYGSSKVSKTIEIGEVVNYLQWELSSTGSADYLLSDVVVRYVNVGTIITDEMED